MGGSQKGGGRTARKAAIPDTVSQASVRPKSAPITRVESFIGSDAPVTYQKDLIHIGQDPTEKNADGSYLCSVANYFSAKRFQEVLDKTLKKREFRGLLKNDNFRRFFNLVGKKIFTQDILVASQFGMHASISLSAIDLIQQQMGQEGLERFKNGSTEHDALVEAITGTYVPLDTRGEDWRVRVSRVDEFEQTYRPAMKALTRAKVLPENIKFYAPEQPVGLMRRLRKWGWRWMQDSIAYTQDGMRDEIEQARKSFLSGNQFFHKDGGGRLMTLTQFTDIGTDISDPEKLLDRVDELTVRMKKTNPEGVREFEFFGIDQREFFGRVEEGVFGIESERFVGSHERETRTTARTIGNLLTGARKAGRSAISGIKRGRRAIRRATGKAKREFTYWDLTEFVDWGRKAQAVGAWVQGVPNDEAIKRFQGLIEKFSNALSHEIPTNDFGNDAWLTQMHGELRATSQLVEAEDYDMGLQEAYGMDHKSAGSITFDHNKRIWRRVWFDLMRPLRPQEKRARLIYDHYVYAEGDIRNGKLPTPLKQWSGPIDSRPKVDYLNLARNYRAQPKFDIKGTGERREEWFIAYHRRRESDAQGNDLLVERRLRKIFFDSEYCGRNLGKVTDDEGRIIFKEILEIRTDAQAQKKRASWKRLTKPEAQKLSREYFYWTWARVKAMQTLGIEMPDVSLVELRDGSQFIEREFIRKNFEPTDWIPSTDYGNLEFVQGLGEQMGLAAARGLVAGKMIFDKGDELIKIDQSKPHAAPKDHILADPVHSFSSTEKPLEEDTDRYSIYLAKLLLRAVRNGIEDDASLDKIKKAFLGRFTGELGRIQDHYIRNSEKCEAQPGQWKKQWRKLYPGKSISPVSMNPKWNISNAWKQTLKRLGPANPRVITESIELNTDAIFSASISKITGKDWLGDELDAILDGKTGASTVSSAMKEISQLGKTD
ncbi:MAG: hypothetical protein ABH950_04020 [Candidatus Altiarchaeota archaeon]